MGAFQNERLQRIWKNVNFDVAETAHYLLTSAYRGSTLKILQRNMMCTGNPLNNLHKKP